MRTSPAFKLQPAHLILAAGALALLSPLSLAHQDAQNIRASEADLDRLLADLDSDDLARREQATQALRNRTGVPEQTCIEILMREDTSPEQRERIFAAIYDRFINSPRAAIGIRLALDPAIAGIRVEEVFRQFPAAEIIQPRDIITHLDGVPLGTAGDAQSQLRQIIISHDPHEVVAARVIRPGATAPRPEENAPANPGAADWALLGDPNARILEIKIPLGSWEELERAQPPEPRDFQTALLYRLSRHGFQASLPPTIECGLDAGSWKRWNKLIIANQSRDLIASGTYIGEHEQSPQALMNRRRERAIALTDAILERADENERLVVRMPDNENMQRAAENAGLSDREIADLEKQVDQFFDRREQLKQTVLRLERDLADPAISVQSRNLLESQRRDALEQMGLVEMKLKVFLEQQGLELKITK